LFANWLNRVNASLIAAAYSFPSQSAEELNVTTETLTPATHLVEAYEGVATDCFTNARADFVRLLPRDPSARILEVGCGNGATGALALARGRARHYAGIESNESRGRAAREILSDVRIGDVERMEFDWQPAAFDALIIPGGLDRLERPGALLRRLSRYIRPGGMVLASAQNMSHWRSLRDLALYSSDFESRSASDSTQYRGMTPVSFCAMFEFAGFRIDHVGPAEPFTPRVDLVSRWTSGRFDHLFMEEIVVQGRCR
jgi:SAM-dependent methyltransferase